MTTARTANATKEMQTTIKLRRLLETAKPAAVTSAA
jgi:hypothetical protein